MTIPLTEVSPKPIDLQLAGGQWVADHLQLLIIGPTGVGKTFLASVLAQNFCRRGYSVHYLKTHELLTELQLAKADGSFPKLRKRLLSFDLLILDEWLRDALNVNQARDFLRAIASYLART